MRILFVSNLYPPVYIGGYEQICYDVARGLKARGHEVHVLTSAYRRSEVHAEETNVFRLLKLKRDWTSFRSGRSSVPGVIDILRVQRHNVAALKRLVGGLRPDVILCWNGNYLGQGILSAAEERAPTAYFLSDAWLAPLLALQRHGASVPRRVRLYRAFLRALGVPTGPLNARRLIFCSRSLREEYEEAGAGVEEGVIIYHGVDKDIFFVQPQHIALSDHAEYSVIYSGQIAPHKGTSTLIEAMGHVRRMPGLQNVTLSFVGSAQSDSYRAQLQDRINELELTFSVRFLQRQPKEELPGIYARHDILAFTSEWREPFALTLLEGMATGIPVVCSLTGGSAEIVRDRENAIAFQAGDSLDLAEKLAWALTHPLEAAAMGLRASEEVTSRYTLDAEVTAIERYLKEMVSEPGR